MSPPQSSTESSESCAHRRPAGTPGGAVATDNNGVGSTHTHFAEARGALARAPEAGGWEPTVAGARPGSAELHGATRHTGRAGAGAELGGAHCQGGHFKFGHAAAQPQRAHGRGVLPAVGSQPR